MSSSGLAPMPSADVVAGSVPKAGRHEWQRHVSIFNGLRAERGRAHAVPLKSGYRVLLRDANYCHCEQQDKERMPQCTYVLHWRRTRERVYERVVCCVRCGFRYRKRTMRYGELLATREWVYRAFDLEAATRIWLVNEEMTGSRRLTARPEGVLFGPRPCAWPVGSVLPARDRPSLVRGTGP